MQDKNWYAARLTENLKPFEQGEVVYIRRALFKEPLAVGEVFILFNPKRMTSIRVAACYGRVWNLWPSNVCPKPAPTEKNQSIELEYRKYLKRNPIAKRHKRIALETKFKGVTA